ncbi:XdhC family protein [Chloroflexota bacterium]
MTDIDIYEEIIRIKKEGEEAALATVISAGGSTPREEGAKMLVRADGSILGTIGGGGLEARIMKEAAEVIRTGESKHLIFRLTEKEELGLLCGGDAGVFIEPIVSLPTLYIFGGGHIGFPLAKMANLVDFRVVVIDNRPEFANPERFPEAEQTLVEDHNTAFSNLKVDKLSYIVIITHGHKGDETVLEGALATKARYIGMIGSKAKVKTVFSHLLNKGISQELLDRVHAPIGLAIGAETPEEIAVSILAEIIQIKRSPLHDNRKTE